MVHRWHVFCGSSAAQSEAGGAMHYVYMLIVGLIVGILARFLYPGPVHLGILGSALLGIAGSYAAGLLSRALQPAATSTAGGSLRPAGILYSIVGAMVLIFLGRMLHLV
jgi:uncharacterized membrane protein YeaQ/YmgE (transglycosylase-associated protein family)